MVSDNVAAQIFGGGLDRTSQRPRCVRMSRITCRSLMKLMMRMTPLQRAIQEGLFHNYLEGDVFTHIQLGGSNPGREKLSGFIRAVYDDSVNRQIDFNPEFTFCSSCQKTARGLHETCSYCGSADVEGIARLTKYFSKISSWNKGKLAELKNRKINDGFGK